MEIIRDPNAITWQDLAPLGSVAVGLGIIVLILIGIWLIKGSLSVPRRLQRPKIKRW